MANIRTVSFVLGLLAATGSLAAAQATQAPVRPVEQPAGRAGAPAGTQTPAPVSDIDARSTREQLRQVLQRYPPDLGRILRMDPTLLQSPTYLAQYPALAQFLAAHPGIVHNPNFYFDFVRDNYDWNEPPDARTESVRMWHNMMEAIGVFCIFVTISLFLSWLVRTFIDYRRWLRISKIQTEVHNKLLDRFASTGDLMTWVQTPAGRRFLESAPIPLDPGIRGVTAPFGRILLSVQAGTVIMILGLGFRWVSGTVIDDVGQPLGLIGSLAFALGIGLILSGVVSYFLSRRLGLLEPMPPPPGAERPDTSPAS